VTGAGVADDVDDLDEIVVHVRLFAVLRERVGVDAVELALRPGATVADAMGALAQQEPLGQLLARIPVHMAVNRDYATAGTVLRPDDELALIPPVSGGDGADPESGVAPRLHVRVSEEPLSLQALSCAVGDPGSGAIVIFQGVTREVERLDYEAYIAMAQERIEAIVRECIAAHDLRAAAVEHRVGSVPLGEPSVIVAVSAAHRDEAFAGAREAIDRLKAEAPIWKREHAAGAPGRWATGAEPPAMSGDSPHGLSHLDEHGRARMVDVGAKQETERVARARARVRMSPASARAVAAGDGPKGEVLGVARLAGVQAAKLTGQLIPLAHPLALTFVDVHARVEVEQGLVELVGEVRTIGRTGVEMEAMTACAVAALTVYDMVKGIEREVEIEHVVLLEKHGGRSDYRREDGRNQSR
jgi:molybdenum cofactor biosynthesis protein MoaC/molybdopterin converting factor subunit 1